jgi:hypothetical protein
MAYNQWRDVTKRYPCPVCGKPDWCSTNGIFICCRRGDGGGVEKQDKSGGTYWLYRVDSGTIDYSSKETELLEPPPSKDSKRTNPDVLHKVYSNFLNMLSLSEAHKENLSQRGLSESEIKLRGYRTLPLRGRSRIARELGGRFGNEIYHVPGFYLKEGDNGKTYLTFAGSPGILIPVRNSDNKILGFKIRVDKPRESGKYVWFSSNGRHGGTGAINSLHFPLFDGGSKDIIRITEGELKADISTALSGIWTWSLPGVNSWRLALPALDEVKPEKVIVAFDSDYWENRNVASHLVAFMEDLQSRHLGGEVV